MSTETQIFAAIYREKPPAEFEDIVFEFESSVRSNSAARHSVSYDYEDTVIIDIDLLRIGLAWVVPEAPDQPYSLIVATGASTGQSAHGVDSDMCIKLSEQILARVQNEIPYDTAVRAALYENLDVDLLDKIAAGLSALEPVPHMAPMQAAQTPQVARTETPEDYHHATEAVIDPAPEPVTPEAPAQPQGAVTQTEAVIDHLRAAYLNAGKDDRAQTSVIWRAMMHSANTMRETLSQGADILRQVSETPQDPYKRLKRRSSKRPVTRLIQQDEHFDKAEYELYGSLLD